MSPILNESSDQRLQGLVFRFQSSLFTFLLRKVKNLEERMSLVSSLTRYFGKNEKVGQEDVVVQQQESGAATRARTSSSLGLPAQAYILSQAPNQPFKIEMHAKPKFQA